MKRILCLGFFILALTIPALAQSDWNTYPVRSLAEIIKAHSIEGPQKADIIISADPFPSKTKAVYVGQRRPIGKLTKDFIKLWVETRNVPAGNADMLIEEALFREDGQEYWIPVLKKLVPFLDKDLKAGDEIIIYYFFLGGYDTARLIQKDTSLSRKEKDQETARAGKQTAWIFAVEEFQKTAADPVPGNRSSASSSGSSYLNQPLAAAISQELKTAGEKDKPLIVDHPVKSKSKVIYTGEIRKVSEKKMRFLQGWAEDLGYPAGILELLTQEAHFREGDQDYWLPIRQKIADEMAGHLKKGDEVVIHTLLAGGLPQADSIEWVFIVGEYTR